MRFLVLILLVGCGAANVEDIPFPGEPSDDFENHLVYVEGHPVTWVYGYGREGTACRAVPYFWIYTGDGGYDGWSFRPPLGWMAGTGSHAKYEPAKKGSVQAFLESTDRCYVRNSDFSYPILRMQIAYKLNGDNGELCLQTSSENNLVQFCDQ